jgi:hypothetical protein
MANVAPDSDVRDRHTADAPDAGRVITTPLAGSVAWTGALGAKAWIVAASAVYASLSR